jgi:hypothetical protein
LKASKEKALVETTVNFITAKLIDFNRRIDISRQASDENTTRTKINDELNTLRDVYEGYEHYIDNVEPLVEPLISDANKLHLCIENNKVSYRAKIETENRQTGKFAC